MNFIIKNKYLMITALIAIVVALFLTVKSYQIHYSSDFIDEVIYSSVLDEQRKIFIRLPENFDANKYYPLVIKSDGNFNLKRWDESLKRLSQTGEIDDSIVVAIPNQFWTDTRNRDLVPPYARKEVNTEARPATDNNKEIFGKADLFLAFIETEVIPYIEHKYKINNNRILSGFSAGGSFVLYTIVTKPDLFTGYFAFSPAAWYDSSVVVKEFAHALPNTAGKAKFLYLSLGGAENPIMTGAFNGLLSALKNKAPKNLSWDHSISPGAEHEENPYVSLPKAITAYYRFKANNKLLNQ